MFYLLEIIVELDVLVSIANHKTYYIFPCNAAITQEIMCTRQRKKNQRHKPVSYLLQVNYT